ncbi:MAG: DEAD/DEAH box helicase, partial [Ardenticatenaceae bacterium]
EAASEPVADTTEVVTTGEVAETTPAEEAEAASEPVADTTEVVTTGEVAETTPAEEAEAVSEAEAPSESQLPTVERVAKESSNSETAEGEASPEGKEVAADSEVARLSEGSEAESTPVKKKSKYRPRRRRRKNKSQTDSASEPVATSQVVEGEEKEKSEEAPKKSKSSRRRRYKKKNKNKLPEEATEENTSQDLEAQSPTEEKESEAHESEATSSTMEEAEEVATHLQWPNILKEDPRRAYKTEPIQGFGAPEAFEFMGMNWLVGQAITALGYVEPTPIQRQAVPVAMIGRDIIGLAQTGTGKTLAFLVPSLHKLVTEEISEHIPRMLIMTPTRELALQVSEDAEYLATHTDLLITTVYGGVSFKQQLKELRSGTDIIVATPGRLLDHIKRNNVPLDGIKVLILDEADRMLDMGFLPEIRAIIHRLPSERQTLLFSATMPPGIERLSMDFQQHPQLIEVARQLPPETIDQRLYPVEKHLKAPLLIHMLEADETMSTVLIFTETKSEAEVVARRLQRANFSIALMHGDRKQREREEALLSLRTGKVRGLVATNVAARGLDIYDISHVINYDMPQTIDDYVHRIGRTARGNATGKAYTFMTSDDEAMVARLESALEKELPRVEIADFNYDVPTPSWAKPSPNKLIESLHKSEGLAERFNRMMRQRR